MTWNRLGSGMEAHATVAALQWSGVPEAAGSLVLLGTLLGAFVSPWFLLLSGFVGAGLTLAGITDTLYRF